MSTTRRWPLLLIASPAAVAIWSGWVALGGMCGFGLVQPFPGIVSWHLDTAITLPVGVESYGAYALAAWLSPSTPQRARKFAKWSALGSLALGALGQVAYHLLAAAHRTRAPWPVVVAVSALPVVTLGFGAALAHLLHAPADAEPEQHETASGTAQGAPLAEPGTAGEADETVPPQALEDDPARQETEAPDDETVRPPLPVTVPAGGPGPFRPEPEGGELARLFAEQMDQVRALPAPGLVAPGSVPEAGAGSVHRERPAAVPDTGGDAVPPQVPYDAESAALIALRATIAAGNGYSNNQLISKFGLTRAQAARVRHLAGEPPELAAVNGSHRS